jgi:hypothetical protein
MTEQEKKLIDKTEYTPIEVCKLQPDTQLLVETQDETVYHFVVINPTEGLVAASGGRLFQRGINVTLVGSYWDDGKTNQRPGIIQKGLCIEFKVSNPKVKDKIHYVSTSPIKSVKIIGPDETWEFEMWEE